MDDSLVKNEDQKDVVDILLSLQKDKLARSPIDRAVIKESLRLHPPAPILMPRMSSQDVKINGYDIKTSTQVLVTAWQIGRDRKSYDQPDEYGPERFLDSALDYKGNDFQLFRSAQEDDAAQGFGLPDGARGEDLDMTENIGAALHRKYPLKVVAITFSD
ncbi:hypothetical protein ACFX10_030607 [Malus domestica]